VGTYLTEADGHAERDPALLMTYDQRKHSRKTPVVFGGGQGLTNADGGGQRYLSCLREDGWRCLRFRRGVTMELPRGQSKAPSGRILRAPTPAEPISRRVSV
jgi:hypothetical protein